VTVELGDVEAERIADMLEALSALQPDEVPGQYDDGMKADATMYATELRDRVGLDGDTIDVPDDAFREPPVLEQVVKDATDALRTEYERRSALEALAAWHMGYSWLLIARSHDTLAEPFAEQFDVSIRAAFIPKHRDPRTESFPRGYRYEVLDVSVLDDPEIRKGVWTEIKNNDHAEDED